MPVVANIVKRNFFRDSLQLMRLSEEAKKLPGVNEAVIAMGTGTNKTLLRQMNLLSKDGEAAEVEDMILAVRVVDASILQQATKSVEDLLSTSAVISSTGAPKTFSLAAALEQSPGSNLAVVSVPGHLAPDLTKELLRRGLHVHLFSDHVPITQEVRLKKYARRRGLLLLGPGAGTSIINGRAIAFANVVRRGDIGIVAAAGTGLQEVSALFDRVGLGISQALGVGGSDMSKQVGGIMTIECLRALERDGLTRMIVVVAKTPTRYVMAKVLRVISEGVSKPVVVCFLGETPTMKRLEQSNHFRLAPTLHAAVAQASLASGEKYYSAFRSRLSMTFPVIEKRIASERRKLNIGQKRIRGLYTGGTLAHEALLIYKETIGEAYSNTPLSNRFRLKNPQVSVGNTVIDLGDEFFTAGRAHPMIDPTFRRLRLLQEARDLAVGTITQDFVLGYGSIESPAGAMLDTIFEASELAKKSGRNIVFMGHVCGTSRDPQSLDAEERKLASAGVLLFPTNALMALASALLVTRDERDRRIISSKWNELLGEG